MLLLVNPLITGERESQESGCPQTAMFLALSMVVDVKVFDEIYQYKSYDRSKVHLLLSLDKHPNNNTPGHYPIAWCKPYGKGRVFYTAWGHNMDTWGNPGFQNLVARGITWACQRDTSKLPAFKDTTRFNLPKMTAARKDVSPFGYTEVGKEIPNYQPGARGGQAEPMSRMQLPLTAVESQKHYVTPEGFQVKLWAIEKDTIDGEADKSLAGLGGNRSR